MRKPVVATASEHEMLLELSNPRPRAGWQIVQAASAKADPAEQFRRFLPAQKVVYFGILVCFTVVTPAYYLCNPLLKMAKNILLGLLLSLTIGCASSGHHTSGEADGGKAKIYVLRKLTTLGGGGIVISGNGKQVGTIHRGSSISWMSEPGTVVIEASAANNAKLSLAVQANQVYFVEVRKSRVARSAPREVEIHPLTEAEGRHLLKTIETKSDPQRGISF